ncbi:hypothetical protein [Chitinophaga sp. MM2321]|uniref:hypothetical protein n=1 Tax=Chitinophaga sp. MM2321 TaxID=3137178 RepID=UPI0032D5A08B
MKKFLIGMLAMFMGLTVAMAQTPATPTAKKEVKTAKVKTEKKAATATPVASADTKLKKDGTPDKRYKENKNAATTSGPKKKDGTPDMRYKSNNKTAGKKKA